MKKLLTILLCFLVLAGCSNNKKQEEQKQEETKTQDQIDHEEFAREYTKMSADNIFVKRSASEIISILEHGTGVVFLGFPECPWCQAYVPYLEEQAKNNGIKVIYYCNILEDRENNTDDYKKIVEILGDNLEYDEEGNHRIYVPNVTFVIKGEIIGNDFETALDTKGYETPEEYWEKEDLPGLKERLGKWSLQVAEALKACDDCKVTND